MDARLARGERVPPLETVRLTRDGRRVDVALTMSLIIDQMGAVVGASGIGRDISERRRADEALRRSQAELRDFVENSASACTGSGPTASFCGRIRPSSTCSVTGATSTSAGTSRNSMLTRRRSRPFSNGWQRHE